MPVDVKNRVRVVRDGALTLPCSLCGTSIPHQHVEPFQVARRIYRATVVGDRAYVPLAHSAAGFCPDPGPRESALWAERTFDAKREEREAYKTARRSAVDKNTAAISLVGWKQ